MMYKRCNYEDSQYIETFKKKPVYRGYFIWKQMYLRIILVLAKVYM